jgi:hypothetical protein
MGRWDAGTASSLQVGAMGECVVIHALWEILLLAAVEMLDSLDTHCGTAQLETLLATL